MLGSSDTAYKDSMIQVIIYGYIIYHHSLWSKEAATNFWIREDVVERVSIEQVAIIAVDDIQGNVHSRDNTRAVEILPKGNYQAEEDSFPVCWKRPGIDAATWIISTGFTS